MIPNPVAERATDQSGSPPPSDAAEASSVPSSVRRNGDGTLDYHERIALAERPALVMTPEAPASTPEARARAEMGTTAHRGARANVLLAVLQLVVGYQWLVSGVDKLLYGHFPDQLGQLVSTALSSGRLPDVFAQLLQNVVLPNAVIFGNLVEYGETLAGLGLLAGALLTLARPLIQDHVQTSAGTGARSVRVALGALGVLTAGAALGALFMGLNYWVLDGMPAPWFTPGLAYGGAIHPALFLAFASATILIGQIVSQIAARRQ